MKDSGDQSFCPPHNLQSMRSSKVNYDTYGKTMYKLRDMAEIRYIIARERNVDPI